MEIEANPEHLRNPFTQYEGYHCFGCCPTNPVGLKLKFFEEGDEIVSLWEIEPDFQGFFGILHGGIQAALMDEIAGWTVYVKAKTAGYTSRAEFRYLHHVGIDAGPLKLRARLKGMRRNLADIEVSLSDNQGNTCATGSLTFFTFSPEKSRNELYYPGDEAFKP